MLRQIPLNGPESCVSISLETQMSEAREVTLVRRTIKTNQRTRYGYSHQPGNAYPQLHDTNLSSLYPLGNVQLLGYEHICQFLITWVGGITHAKRQQTSTDQV